MQTHDENSLPGNAAPQPCIHTNRHDLPSCWDCAEQGHVVQQRSGQHTPGPLPPSSRSSRSVRRWSKTLNQKFKHSFSRRLERQPATRYKPLDQYSITRTSAANGTNHNRCYNRCDSSLEVRLPEEGLEVVGGTDPLYVRQMQPGLELVSEMVVPIAAVKKEHHIKNQFPRSEPEAERRQWNGETDMLGKWEREQQRERGQQLLQSKMKTTTQPLSLQREHLEKLERETMIEASGGSVGGGSRGAGVGNVGRNSGWKAWLTHRQRGTTFWIAVLLAVLLVLGGVLGAVLALILHQSNPNE